MHYKNAFHKWQLCSCMCSRGPISRALTWSAHPKRQCLSMSHWWNLYDCLLHSSRFTIFFPSSSHQRPKCHKPIYYLLILVGANSWILFKILLMFHKNWSLSLRHISCNDIEVPALVQKTWSWPALQGSFLKSCFSEWTPGRLLPGRCIERMFLKCLMSWGSLHSLLFHL